MKTTRLYLTTLLLLLLSSGLFAQRKAAKLIFKDGTVIRGLARVSNLGSIKFRKAKKEKPEWYKLSEDLEKAMLLEDGAWVTYVSKKVKDRAMSQVLTEIAVGKVSLYSKATRGFNYAPMPGTGGAPMMTSSYSIENSYVQQEGETEVTHLGSNQLFTKNFKKAASAYFEDCPELVAKIQAKEFKKRDLKEIVNFYNTNCN